MDVIQAKGQDHRTLNEAIRQTECCTVQGCMGQRFLGAGMKNVHMELEGIPGNALGAYLAGAEIFVHGNAQDAVGDTMNDGRIVINGSAGDAVGYAMRGGRIYIRGSAGYRAGIHMKAYREKQPLIIIGGRTGSFLGEYQAGGVIIVLGLHTDGKPIVGNFPCTGMHGGKMFLRGTAEGIIFPKNVCVKPADADDLAGISGYLADYCAAFGMNAEVLMRSPFTVITPDTANPYKQLYVAN